MYYIGVDIGGMSMKIGIVNEKGKIKLARSIPTQPQEGYKVMIKRIADTISDMCKDIKLDINEVSGIGLGIPGVADSRRGVVTIAANIGWKEAPIVDELAKYFNKPITISNDANCAALGEQKFGGGTSYSSIVFITLGTGVGSGIVIDDKLVEGVGSAGAESGHMVIVVDGEPCNCGRNGCWEAYASATALIRQTTEAMNANPTSKMNDIANKAGKVSGRTAFLAADEGDEGAKVVVDKYIKYIGTGLANLGNILHPQAFIIGGGISHEGEGLIKPLQEYVNHNILGADVNPPIKVVQATLGNDAGIIGAAALVM